MRLATSDPRPCRSCGASVLWLAHAKSRNLAPIDAEPNPEGNVKVDIELGIYRIDPANGTHTNHFATCPNAASHRRPA